MRIEAIPVGPLQVNCFVVWCPATRQAMVVDPGDEPGLVLDVLEEEGLSLKMVVNTHGHFDHIGGNRGVLEEAGGELLIHENDAPLMKTAPEHAALYGLQAVLSPEPTRLLSGGEVLELGELTFQVVFTPGHSPGGICLYGQGHLFSGDALFAGSIGRTDLPGGDHHQLIDGIRKHIMSLPEGTVVHPGHGPDTTIGREIDVNPFVGMG